MKVVFIEEVPGTAVPGEVKEVRDGFARNYLLPRKLAIAATKSALQRADALSKKEEKRQAHLDADAQKIVDKLEGQTILIRARVGEQGRLYGSVTAADVANRIDELLGEPIDRRRIMLNTPIREVGTRQVPLRLTRNVQTAIEVIIEADETSSRGRRSTAPAGGTILMAPRRGRAAQEEFEAELEAGGSDFEEEEVGEEDIPEEDVTTGDESEFEDAQAIADDGDAGESDTDEEDDES